MSHGARRWMSALLLALTGAALLGGGWRWSEAWQFRKTIERIEDEMGRGLQSLAAKELAELLARNPGSDEVAFLLGTCEKARGRSEAAAAAWARVRLESAFAFEALEARVALLLERGEFTEAEQLVIGVCASRRMAGPDPTILLGPIYSQQGRLKESMQVIETLWLHHNELGEAASETAINQLWLYIQLPSNQVPDETFRANLERAGLLAPDDDRVWLSKANLAIRTQSYEEAARWLGRCLARRPEDVAVWRARLDWALATRRVAVAREALKHLPAAESNSAEVEKLAAWFAAQRGDDKAERTSLERLIAADPTDFAAVDRLIELRTKNGQPDVALALRRRKDEVARLQARYQKLFKRHQPRRDAAEMARLAEQLGRRFEAKAFFTIALASARDAAGIRRDFARLTQNTETFAGSARTLDELLSGIEAIRR
jgi:thioredoxin-like negative regulator of GroEL